MTVADLVIRGGRIVDGTGGPSTVADLAVNDGRISRVGRLTSGGGHVIEEAVHKLSGQPAAMLSLADRGVIRAGAVADLVLFDPDRLGSGATYFLDDFPTGASRLVHEPTGYVAVIVGGQTLLRDGKPTGDLPGQVLTRP